MADKPRFSGEKVKLGAVAKVNPKAEKLAGDKDLVSFLPLASVHTDGTTESGETFSRSEVKKGHPYFRRGDILVAKITPSFENGKIALAVSGMQEGYSSTEFHVVRPMPDRVDSYYLLAYLRSSKVRVFCSRRMKGSAGQKRVPREVLAGLALNLPALDVQRERAAKFKEIASLIAANNQQIKKLNQLIKSRFVEMFGDAQVGYKYRLQSLGSVLSTEPQNGLYKPQSFYVEKGGSPIVRVDAFQKGYIEDYSALKRLTCTSAELETYELVNNDIVINRVNGSIDRVGKIAWIRGLREPTVFESNMMRFHIDEKRMDLAFVTTYLNSDDIRQQIKACARIANQCSINQTNVANFVIPAPPLDLQQQFADFVAQVDKSRFVACFGWGVG